MANRECEWNGMPRTALTEIECCTCRGRPAGVQASSLRISEAVFLGAFFIQGLGGRDGARTGFGSAA